jgi:hypothetical protein
LDSLLRAVRRKKRYLRREAEEGEGFVHEKQCGGWVSLPAFATVLLWVLRPREILQLDLPK